MATRVHQARAPRAARQPGGCQEISPGDRPKIIPGLDGLRALAIISVLIYHLRPQTLTGGFIGVDIFFVVSGFLITTLLLREVSSRGFIDLKGFWTRRARRLIPALVVCVLVSVTAAYFVGGDLLVGIGRQTLGALTFSNNWLEIGAGTSYFARTSPQLFVNFWSLAVEEQFYLLWPIIVAFMLAATKSSSTRVRIVFAVAAGSAIWMAINAVPGQDATRAYYGTDTHLFGLMFGAALAFAWGRYSVLDTRLWHRWRIPASLLAAVILATLLVTVTEDAIWTFRGGLVLASLATTVIIAAVITGKHPFLPVMEAWPVRWVGERSYGIYLWHWPVILILEAMTSSVVPDSAASWVVRALALSLTLSIAAVSYRYLETPIRRHGFKVCIADAIAALRSTRRWQPRAIAATAGACLLVMPVAIATAPEKSETQIQIEQGEKLLKEKDAAAPQPSAESPASPDDTDAHTGDGIHDDGAGTGDPAIVSPTLNTTVPKGEEISAFGDSLLVTTIHALEDRFPGIRVDAKSSRQWPEGLTRIRTALDEGSVRRGVVIALGTNAGLPEPDLLRDALDSLGTERLVVVVNIHGKSTWTDAVNEDIARIANEYANVTVADWHTAIGEHRDLLQADGVHPGIEGAHLYADTIKDSFAELAKKTEAAQHDH